MWSPPNLRSIVENLSVFCVSSVVFESANAQFSKNGWIAHDCTLSGRFVGDALCLHALLLIQAGVCAEREASLG